MNPIIRISIAAIGAAVVIGRGRADARTVRFRDRRDAARPRSGRLAHVAAHARHLGLQPAEADRQEQRRALAHGLDASARARNAGRHSARARRRHVFSEPERRDPGARRRERRPALGIPAHAAGRFGDLFPRARRSIAIWRSTATRSSTRARTTSCSRSTLAAASCSGRRRFSTISTARSRRRGRSSRTAKSFPAAVASPRAARWRA